LLRAVVRLFESKKGITYVSKKIAITRSKEIVVGEERLKKEARKVGSITVLGSLGTCIY
jgi:hypothetical protein